MLECVFVAMDPFVAAGALVEIYQQGGRYILLETSATTGNRLLGFETDSRRSAYAMMSGELGRVIR